MNKEIRRDYIDNFVLDELYNRLFSQTSLQKLTAMLNEYNMRMSLQSDSEISQVKAKLKENQAKIDKIVKLITLSDISIDTVSSNLKSLETEKNELESYLNELEQKQKLNSISENKVKELIEKSAEFIRTKKMAESRSFIEAYVERVIVYADKVEIIFKVNIIDDDTGEIIQMKSEENIEVLRADYQDISKKKQSSRKVS